MIRYHNFKKIRLILSLTACGFVLQWGCVSRIGVNSDDIKIEICVPNSQVYVGATAFFKTNVNVNNKCDVSKVLDIMDIKSKPFDESKRLFFGFETVQVFERNGVPYMISIISANGHVCILRELDMHKTDFGYFLYGFKKRSDYDNHDYYQWFHDYFETVVTSDPQGTIGAYLGRVAYNPIFYKLLENYMRQKNKAKE